MYATVVKSNSAWSIHSTKRDYTGYRNNGYSAISFRRYAEAWRYVMDNGHDTDILDIGGSINNMIFAA